MTYLGLEASAYLLVYAFITPSTNAALEASASTLWYAQYACYVALKARMYQTIYIITLYTQYSYYVALKASAYVPSTKQYTV